MLRPYRRGDPRGRPAWGLGASIMGIFTDNPVLQREMRSRLRLRRVLASKPMAWVAGMTTVVIVYFYIKGLIAIGRGEANDARDLWSYLVLFLLLLIVVIAPALLSTAITQEREQQTWDSLTSTNLTAGEVLLGKWLARLSLTALPVVVLLPFLIGCSVKGDIGALTDMAVLLFLALTAGTYGVLGLLCSFFARKTVTATVVALTVTIFLCVGTFIVDALLSSFLRAASTDYSYQDSVVLWLSPFFALNALVLAVEPQGVGMISPSGTASNGDVVTAYLLGSFLAAAAGLAWMTARYRHAARE